ncbi:MAG: tRNA (guanine(10)-N(2))-dimethyltransferase [Nitrososphaerales archaeon]
MPDTTSVQEGDTTLIVPVSSGPSKIPAFFNPRGKFVRDVSIVCYNAFAGSRSDIKFADALAGIGARGIRVAREVESCARVFMNDINPTAIALAKKSAELNQVDGKCSLSNLEACSFLVSREGANGERFDIVDLDPFGTPSPFIDCAIRSVSDGGMLSLAATDSAVLCGVYPAVAERKYLGRSLRTDYSHEVGMRLIFGLIAMTAMRLETGIVPLFCHHDMHYFRAYVQIKVGNSYSRENEKKIGFVAHCFNCGFRATLEKEEIFESGVARKKSPRILNERIALCPACAKPGLKLGGPLWIGDIQSRSYVESCSKISEVQLFREEELDIPLYYDLTALSQTLRLRTPKITEVISRLQGAGHLAGRTRLNPQAVRTNAPLTEIRSVVQELAL